MCVRLFLNINKKDAKISDLFLKKRKWNQAAEGNWVIAGRLTLVAGTDD